KVVLASDDLDRLVVVVGGQELRLITRATREVRWRATWQNAIIDVTADRACDRIMILDEQGESVIYDTSSNRILDRRHALRAVVIHTHGFDTPQQYPALARRCRLCGDGDRAAVLGGLDIDFFPNARRPEHAYGVAAIWDVGEDGPVRVLRGFARDI